MPGAGCEEVPTCKTPEKVLGVSSQTTIDSPMSVVVKCGMKSPADEKTTCTRSVATSP